MNPAINASNTSQISDHAILLKHFLLVLLLASIFPSAYAQTPGSSACKIVCQYNLSEEKKRKCECSAVITKGSSTSNKDDDLGWPTPQKAIPEMIRAHEEEMAGVENYLTIEKINITPMPDMRYFERGEDGEIVHIPTIEVQRRQMAIELTGSTGTGTAASVDSSGNPRTGMSAEDREMRQRVADDPSVALAEMAKALNLLGDELLGEGALGGLTAGVLEAAEGASGAYEEAKDGVKGVDDSDGLFGENSLKTFISNGHLDDTVIGLFHLDGLVFERIENQFKGLDLKYSPGQDPGDWIDDQVKKVWHLDEKGVGREAYQRSMDLNEREHHVNWQWLVLMLFNQMRLEPGVTKETYTEPEGSFYSVDFLDRNKRICDIYYLEESLEDGDELKGRISELWVCYESALIRKPVRLLTSIIDDTLGAGAEVVDSRVERIATEYRKNGTARLPHLLREAKGYFKGNKFRPSESSMVIRQRKYLINQGLPDSEEWTQILSDAMSNPFPNKK